MRATSSADRTGKVAEPRLSRPMAMLTLGLLAVLSSPDLSPEDVTPPQGLLEHPRLRGFNIAPVNPRKARKTGKR